MILSHLRPALVLLLLFTALTGVAYPLAVLGVARTAFPRQSEGDPVERDGVTVGFAAIGQAFVHPQYFHGRPSATGYDGVMGHGSNDGPTSRTLVDRVAAAVAAVRHDNPGRDLASGVPVDLATASASGLDPHISPRSALLQAPRVAAARGLSEDAVRALVERSIEGRQWGVFGEPRVNVLLLNLELDRLAR